MTTHTRRLEDVVATGDAAAIIARGHHAVHAALLRIVAEDLPTPDAIDLTRLDFAVLADFAVALDVVTAELRPTLREVDALRARALSDPGGELGERDVAPLWDALFEHLRGQIDPQEDPVDRLGAMLLAVEQYLRHLSRYHQDLRSGETA